MLQTSGGWQKLFFFNFGENQGELESVGFKLPIFHRLAKWKIKESYGEVNMLDDWRVAGL